MTTEVPGRRPDQQKTGPKHASRRKPLGGRPGGEAPSTNETGTAATPVDAAPGRWPDILGFRRRAAEKAGRRKIVINLQGAPLTDESGRHAADSRSIPNGVAPAEPTRVTQRDRDLAEVAFASYQPIDVDRQTSKYGPGRPSEDSQVSSEQSERAPTWRELLKDLPMKETVDIRELPVVHNQTDIKKLLTAVTHEDTATRIPADIDMLKKALIFIASSVTPVSAEEIYNTVRPERTTDDALNFSTIYQMLARFRVTQDNYQDVISHTLAYRKESDDAFTAYEIREAIAGGIREDIANGAGDTLYYRGSYRDIILNTLGVGVVENIGAIQRPDDGILA